MSCRRQILLARVNRYLQSSLKHITELITGNKYYYRGGRYRQVPLYDVSIKSSMAHRHMYAYFVIMLRPDTHIIFEVALMEPAAWFPLIGPFFNQRRTSPICVSKIGQDQLRKCLVAFSSPSHYLNRCLVIVDYIIGEELRKISIKIIQFPLMKMPLIYRVQPAGHLFALKILNNCQATFQSLQLTEKLDDSMILSASNLGEVVLCRRE